MNRLVYSLTRFFPSDPSLGRIGSIDINIWLAQVVGLPLLGHKQQGTVLKVLLIIYGLLVIPLINLMYPLFEFYDLFYNWRSLDAITQNTCLTLSHLAGAWKIFNTFWRLPDIYKSIEKLKAISKKFVISEEQRRTFMLGEAESKVFLAVYISVVGSTCVMSCILLILYPNGLAGKYFPYRVKLPNCLPRDLQLAYIGLSLSLFALQIISVDYLNIAIINQLRYQLDILKLAFNEITLNAQWGHKQSLLKLRAPVKQLKFIVQHHCALVDVRNDIEEIYRFPILLQFLTSLLIFALTGFRATVSSGSGQGDMMIYFYCGCIFCQLFLYCWFGNEVYEKCKSLAMSGYSSSWYEFDERFKNSLQIFLGNAQRPFMFTAGGFMGLSLPSFAGILSKSYSFIALLRQLNTK